MPRGIVLLSLVPYTDLPARAAANVAILTGAALSWTGARVFAGRSPRPVLVVAGAALWLAVHLLVRRNLGQAPGVLAFLFGAAYILATAAELWREQAAGSLTTRNMAIALLGVHGGIYLIQAVGNAVEPAFFTSNGVFLILMLEGLLHTVVIAFLFLALIKERAEMKSTVRLREMATHDGLTGLGNRWLFDQALKQEVRLAARARMPLSLLMIDVDQFKKFNDLYGHQAGDRCLQSVALAIAEAIRRPGDLAARYGGEEFAVLLPGTDAAGATAVAEAVRNEVERLRISHAGSSTGCLTISVGSACVVPDVNGSPSDELVAHADRALYAAKAAGRNTTVGSSRQAAG